MQGMLDNERDGDKRGPLWPNPPNRQARAGENVARRQQTTGLGMPEPPMLG